MDEKNKPTRPERNKRSYIITIILIVLIVGMILIIGRNSIFNTSTTWTKDQLSTYLRLANVENPDSSSVYVATAKVSQNYRATTVSGTAVTTGTKTMYKYTVTIENSDWDTKDIEYKKFDLVSKTYSTETGSWAEIFENRVAE